MEELLYLNPYSEFHILDKLKQEQRQSSPGKIRKEPVDTLGITAQEEWRKLEKSLEKLKEAGKKRGPLNDS
jgi:phage terminase small subunit